MPRKRSTEWERGFNDGIAWAVSECYRNGYEGAGREMVDQVSYALLRREHRAELLSALRRGDPDLARKLVADYRATLPTGAATGEGGSDA